LPSDLEIGGLIVLAATVVNLLVARLLVNGGRTHGFIVLEAEGQHPMSDVWTSVAVLLGRGLVRLTGLACLDPVAALLVAVHLVRTGVDRVRRSFNGLMDHALPVQEQTKVRAAIEAHRGPVMDFHTLCTRQARTRRFVDFHLLVPGVFSVAQAHALTGKIEDGVQAVLPGVEVTVHSEPLEERAAWKDTALVPLEQAARRAEAETRGQGLE
jgi:cation diffusion facilitator family transporter